MFAPRRRPPCLIIAVAWSKRSINDSGPDSARRMDVILARAQGAK